MSDVKDRKKFIRTWVHSHPEVTRKEASRLYDELERRFPEISRGGHRGLVGREDPWDTISHQCPKCEHEVEGIQNIKEAFGFRNMTVDKDTGRKKTYVQSWCRECRAARRKGELDERIKRLNPTNVEFDK